MDIWWSLAWYIPITAFLLLLGGRRLVALLAQVGRPVAYFWTVVVVGLLGAQLVLPERSLYPLAAWDMYGEPSPNRTAWAFFVVQEDGQRERLNRTWPLRGLDSRALMAGPYRHLLEARALNSGELPHEAVEELRDFFEAVLGPSPFRETQSIEVRWCTWAGAWPGLEAACLREPPAGVLLMRPEPPRDGGP